MSIDERVAGLVLRLPLRPANGQAASVTRIIKTALLDVARDQRHACAEAVLAVSNIGSRDEIDTAIEAGAAHLSSVEFGDKVMIDEAEKNSVNENQNRADLGSGSQKTSELSAAPSSFTPAPWKVNAHGYDSPYLVKAFIETAGGTPICGLYRGACGDAYLIAAAPELLRLLKSALDHLEERNVHISAATPEEDWRTERAMAAEWIRSELVRLGLAGAATKQDWLDAMGVPAEFAYTYEHETCPNSDTPCACQACRSYCENDEYVEQPSR